MTASAKRALLLALGIALLLLSVFLFAQTILRGRQAPASPATVAAAAQQDVVPPEGGSASCLFSYSRGGSAYLAAAETDRALKTGDVVTLRVSEDDPYSAVLVWDAPREGGQLFAPLLALGLALLCLWVRKRV